MTGTVSAGGFQIEGDCFVAYTGAGTHVVVPAGVRRIAGEAFLRDPALRSVVFPDSLEEIGEKAFQGCEALRDILPGNRLRTIGSFAFADCPAMRMPSFPDSLREIGAYAFSWSLGSGSGASLRDSVPVMPDGLTSLGEGAFWGCKGISVSESLKNPMLGRVLYDPEKKSGHWAESIRFKGHVLTVRDRAGAALYKIWMFSRSEQPSCLNALTDLWAPLGNMDFPVYDKLFSSMVSKEDKTRAAIYRLLYPRELPEDAADRYCSWIARHAAESIAAVEAGLRPMLLKFFADRDLLSPEQEEAVFDAVTCLEDTACLAWLIRRRTVVLPGNGDDLRL